MMIVTYRNMNVGNLYYIHQGNLCKNTALINQKVDVLQ